MKKNKYLGVGISLGVAIGVITDHLGLWLCLGIAIGAGLDATLKNGERESTE